MKNLLPDFVHGKVLPVVYDTFLQHGRKELLRIGDIFIKAGLFAERVYMVIEGNCVFIHTDDKGLSRSCGLLPAGGLAGLGPAWQKRPIEVDVMCLEPVMVYSVPAEFFIREIHMDLAVENALLKHVLGSMSAMYRTMMLQISLNLPQRLAMFLRAYASCAEVRPGGDGRIFLPLRLTHEKLGMIISATRVTTTILLNHLGKMKMLEQGKGGMTFPERLIAADFIADELCKDRWAKIRAR